MRCTVPFCPCVVTTQIQTSERVGGVPASGNNWNRESGESGEGICKQLVGATRITATGLLLPCVVFLILFGSRDPGLSRLTLNSNLSHLVIEGSWALRVAFQNLRFWRSPQHSRRAGPILRSRSSDSADVLRRRLGQFRRAWTVDLL